MLFSRGKHAAALLWRPRWLLPLGAGIATAAATVGAVLLITQHLRRPQQPTIAPPTSSALPAPAESTTTDTSTTTTSTTTATSSASKETVKKTTKATTRTTIPSVKPPRVEVESGNVNDDHVKRTTRTTTRTTAADGYVPVRPDRVCLPDLPHLYGSKGNLVGIDVSRHNGDINWAKVKAAGIRYAIIRCGYRTTVGGKVYEDANFRKNIQGALAADIPVGVYFFSAAKTRQEALEEAAFVLEVIKGYDITWPVVFDFEICGQDRLKGVSDTVITDNAMAFMDYIAQAGYNPMLYCNRNMLRDNFETGRLGEYRIWMAQYTELSNKLYPAPHVMWQCASDGLVDGIDGWVDLNIAYEDLGKASAPYIEPKKETAFKGFSFAEAWDIVELKFDTNLRISPYLDHPNKYRLTDAGTKLLRTGMDKKSGWSRLEWNGVTVYTLTERLTFVKPAPTTTTTTPTTVTTTTTAPPETGSSATTETSATAEDSSPSSDTTTEASASDTTEESSSASDTTAEETASLTEAEPIPTEVVTE